MKLPKLSTATLLALTTCVAMLQQVSAIDKHQNSKKNHEHHLKSQEKTEAAGFDAQCHNNGQHEQHGHQKQHGQHEQPHQYHYGESGCTQLNLVCDKIVIDSITCQPLKEIGLMDGTSVFEKSNQCSKDQCKKISSVKNINMDEPCYNLPTECAGGPMPLDGRDDVDSSPDYDEDGPTDDDNADEDNIDIDGDGGEDEDEDEDIDALNAQLSSLRKRHNSPKHQPPKSHHRKKPSHPRKKEKHPWTGLCVTKGSVCGSDLFGCDSISNAVYTCSQVAAKPKYVKTCMGKCVYGSCETETASTATENPKPTATTPITSTKTTTAKAPITTRTTTTAEPNPTTNTRINPSGQITTSVKTTTTINIPRTLTTTTTTTVLSNAPLPTTTTIATAEASTTTTTNTPSSNGSGGLVSIATTTTTTTTTTTRNAATNPPVLGTTTTTSVPAIITLPPIPIPLNCTTVANVFTTTIQTAFNTIDGVIALIPPPLSTTLAPVLAAYNSFKATVTTLLADPGNLAALSASSATQLSAILQTFSGAITNQTGLPPEILTPIFTALNLIGTAAQDLATCLGAPKNCLGLLSLIGYAIKSLLPYLQNYITTQGGVLAIVAGPAIALASTTADQLISGNPAGLTSVQTLLTLVNSFAGFLPSEAKLPLDILKAIVDAAVKCQSTP
ncbi:hypothetical protein BGX28_004349 [Mortierella sp. GBA30]|nr:hypothetical protein BGX28_004349 [Mortierella sp. GBA30]